MKLPAVQVHRVCSWPGWVWVPDDGRVQLPLPRHQGRGAGVGRGGGAALPPGPHPPAQTAHGHVLHQRIHLKCFLCDVRGQVLSNIVFLQILWKPTD